MNKRTAIMQSVAAGMQNPEGILDLADTILGWLKKV